MTTAAKDPVQLRFWERLLSALFGWALVRVDGGPVIHLVCSVAGWAIIAAAMGLVEMAMAVYYRARRRLT